MGKTFNMVGGGANVVANPAMTGTETDLQGLEVNGTKYKVPLIRPNLLDNWYFVGGGSQQGGGQLPINQKGQTSYTGNEYTIDRWNKPNTMTSLTVNTTGVKFQRTSSTSYPTFIQKLTIPAGTMVTLSALVKSHFERSGNTILGRFSLSDNSTPTIFKIDSEYADFTLLSGTLTPTLDITEVRFQFSNPSTTSSVGDWVEIAAVKLELGDTQTLAHNEGTEANPVWVLNEIPNYTEELWKCQRYYQLFASSSYRPTYGEDYRPPMRLHSPTKGTISIGGTTYYYADAKL